MYYNAKLACLFLIGFVFILQAQAQSSNTVTLEEKQQGWHLLFDGESFNGWINLTDSGWMIKDGELSAIPSSDHKQRDIITEDRFDNFELYFEFKISAGTNSGVKYLVSNDYVSQEGSYLGLEYQILDDEGFTYPDRGEFRSSSSLYDLIPATKKNSKPIGQWNAAKVIVNKNHIEHWLNGFKVLEFDRSSDSFNALVMQSKYNNLESFGKRGSGVILLQNEGTPISFRNLKIRHPYSK